MLYLSHWKKGQIKALVGVSGKKYTSPAKITITLYKYCFSYPNHFRRVNRYYLYDRDIDQDEKWPHNI